MLTVLILGTLGLARAATLTLVAPSGTECTFEAVTVNGQDLVNTTCPLLSSAAESQAQLLGTVNALILENAQLRARLDALESSVALPPSPPNPPSPPPPPAPPSAPF